MSLKITPSVGVARLGNSTTEICLSPDRIGGLPFDANANGDKTTEITSFRDADGMIKRQGQQFRVYDGTQEILPGADGWPKLEWTVHLANKKGAWRQYSELDGNLLYGDDNSYADRGVEWRNGTTVTQDAEVRRPFLIDPGPRTLMGPGESAQFDRASSMESDYPYRFPDYSEDPNNEPKFGAAINTLGEIRTDSAGRLVVLGGFGNSGGDEKLENYGGQNTWHDDISDGPVYCTVRYEDDTTVELQAWIIVGSPDFAPQIVNISNLSDTMFDVSVRRMGSQPTLHNGSGFLDSFLPNYQRDILPILERMEKYQWVSNIQPMMTMGSQRFDYADKTLSTKDKREAIFAYFRAPDGVPPRNSDPAQQTQQVLFTEGGGNRFPQMPLNSGSNSVSNDTIVKFLALNETQYFFMQQWAAGNFINTPPTDNFGIDPADQAQVGNCVGLPMCPGIEVTWSMQNDVVYESPYVIKDFRGKGGYDESGLSPNRDECEQRTGCEPGDLTKRMANPWQADFFQCTIQYINFTNPTVNKNNGVPVPPAYYSYWWPPQSPWDVLTENATMHGENPLPLTHLPMGEQMNYQRGINSFDQMIEYWHALGFIRDLNPGNPGFPYFLETERSNEIFRYEDYPISNITNNPFDQVTIPVFYIEADTGAIAAKSERAGRLVAQLEKVNFKKVEVHPDGLPHPRRGTLRRR